MKDLREFIDAAHKVGEVREIEGADWDLEIGAITELTSERSGQALLFSRIKGYTSGKVFSNAFSTPKRTALALGLPLSMRPMEILETWRKRVRDFKGIKPKWVSNAPASENIDQADSVDLLKFPAPRWHKLDGGRYIGTGTAFVQKDPDSGFINLGAYRAMIHDKNTLGIYISPGRHGWTIMKKYHARGESCPVAIVCGSAPVVFMEAAYHIPDDVSGYEFAGWLSGEPVEIIKGASTGLPVPATAELIIEGAIPPNEEKTEGPFGEWTGYYSPVAREPVVRVSAVMYRDDPIILGTPPLKPPLKGEAFGVNLSRVPSIWNQLDGAGVPNVKGVWNLEQSTGSMVTVVSIKQSYSGHAMQTGLVAAGCRAGAYLNRFVIVVDDDIDITNPYEVLWAMATRCEPTEDIEIFRKNWSSRLDPRLSQESRDTNRTTNSKAIILAVRPFELRETYPKVNQIDSELREKITRKWFDVESESSNLE